MANRGPNRPREYNELLAIEICGRIASGMSLTKACQPAHLPAHTTFLSWVTKAERGDSQWSPLFERYRRARQAQAHSISDEALETARKSTKETAQADRVKCDTFRWIAARHHPAVYGDFQRLELSGTLKLESPRDQAPDWMRSLMSGLAPAALPAPASNTLPALALGAATKAPVGK